MTTRSAKKSAFKDDIKHCLQVLWDIEIEQPLFKTFTRDFLGASSIHSTLGFSKQDVNALSCKDDDGTILYLQTYEVGKSV